MVLPLGRNNQLIQCYLVISLSRSPSIDFTPWSPRPLQTPQNQMVGHPKGPMLSKRPIPCSFTGFSLVASAILAREGRHC